MIGFSSVNGRFWRMFAIRWQREPLASGSHKIGARFNRRGMPALYLSADHATAIAEYHQLDPRPGTLVGYDIDSAKIVPLIDAKTCDAFGIDPADIACAWYDLLDRNLEPPTWPIVDELYAQGAHGALVPSFQRDGATNLVLWRWHRAGTAGEGAAVTLVDPGGDLLP